MTIFHMIIPAGTSDSSVALLWTISYAMTLLIVVLVGVLIISRIRFRKKEALKASFTSAYQTSMLEYFNAQDTPDELSEQQRFILNMMKVEMKEKYKRRIILNVLRDLKNEMSGEIAGAINYVYHSLGFLHFTKEKLKHSNWKIVAIGIRDLKEFEVKSAQKSVLSFINHPIEEVRREAQLYMIQVFKFEGLSFLDQLKQPLSTWDQILILGLLRHFENQDIPDTSKWLSSENTSVVAFALHLITIYNQFQMEAQLINLLDHPSQTLRIRTIEVLTYFQSSEAKRLLKDRFSRLSTEEQEAFFLMLQDMNEPLDTTFIREHYNASTFTIKNVGLTLLKTRDNFLFEEEKKELQNEDALRIVHYLEST